MVDVPQRLRSRFAMHSGGAAAPRLSRPATGPASSTSSISPSPPRPCPPTTSASAARTAPHGSSAAGMPMMRSSSA
jgi:hypothetical protein